MHLRTYCHTTLYGGSLAKFVKPTFEVFEFADILTLPFPIDRPWIANHVRDSVFVTAQVALVIKLVVEDAVKSIDLVSKAGDCVGLIASIDT